MNAFSCLSNQVSACIPVGGKYYQEFFLSPIVALDNKFLAACFTVDSSGSQTGGESQLLSKGNLRFLGNAKPISKLLCTLQNKMNDYCKKLLSRMEAKSTNNRFFCFACDVAIRLVLCWLWSVLFVFHA